MEMIRKENEERLKDLSVCELYLAKRALTAVPDLSALSQLRYVWLNNNRIKDINSDVFHCCLAELYLQNNELTSISGALGHLSCLQVLLLHNNQLKDLEETVTELRKLYCLHTVNFFLNPFTLDPQYRQYVIHHLPSVQILDRKEVRQKERKQSFQTFSAERQRTLDTLAFGRRALTPPVGRKMCNSTFQSGDLDGSRIRCKNPFEEMEDHSEHRSITQFSLMDWCCLTPAQESPLEESRPTAANILTVKFR